MNNSIFVLSVVCFFFFYVRVHARTPVFGHKKTAMSLMEVVAYIITVFGYHIYAIVFSLVYSFCSYFELNLLCMNNSIFV